MIINRLSDGNFQVIQSGMYKIMTFDEVMCLLSKPADEPEISEQDKMKEFWESEPAYPTHK